MKQARTFGLALLLLLWIAGVIAFYYVVHKPWGDIQGIVPIAQAFLDIGLSVSLIGLAGGLGRRLVGSLPEASPLERMALQAAIGLGVLGLTVLAVGMVGGLYRWLAWLALAVGLLVLKKEWLAWLAECRHVVPNAPLSLLEKSAGWFMLLVIILNLLKALAPPLKWDSLVYHLELPRQYLQAGGIVFLPENLYAGFPQMAEMVFTWAMALGSERTAVTLGWAIGLVALLGVEGMSRRRLGSGLAWMAPAILLSGASLAGALSWAYVDLWVMLFGLGILVALDCYRYTQKRSWLIYASILAGFAIGTKYTAVVMLPIGAVLLLPIWDKDLSSESGKLRQFLVNGVLFVGIALLVACPWLLKNQILAGNLVYPFSFGGALIDPWRQVFQSGAAPVRSIQNDLLLPFDATLFGIEGAVVTGRFEYGASLGPLLLALIPALLVCWGGLNNQQQRDLVPCLGLVGCTWLIWALAAHFADELSRPRHYYGVFPVLAVLAAAGVKAASGIRLPHVRLGRIISSLILLAFLLSAMAEGVAFIDADPLPVIIGRQTEMEYISQELGWYGDAIQAVNQLPHGALVLFIWEPRTFYCELPCIPDGTLDNWWYLRRAVGNAGAIASALKGRGVTNVLINNAGAHWMEGYRSNYNNSDWIEFTNFKQTELILVGQFEESYSLYSLASEQSIP